MESNRIKVLGVNRLFYKAFEGYDIKMMGEVWSKSENARCVRPGWKTPFGWDNVRQGWEAIFANRTIVKFELRDIQVGIAKVVTFVLLIEEITVNADGYNIVATNIFENIGAGWQMILHHGSVHSYPDRTSQYN